MKNFLLFLTWISIAFSVNPQELSSYYADYQSLSPNYSYSENWCALPFRKDAANYLPAGETWIVDDKKQLMFSTSTLHYSSKANTGNPIFKIKSSINALTV